MRSCNSYQEIKSPEDEEFDSKVEFYVNNWIEDYIEETGHKPDCYTIGQMRKQAKNMLSDEEFD